jgi:hypothetical protein
MTVGWGVAVVVKAEQVTSDAFGCQNSFLRAAKES